VQQAKAESLQRIKMDSMSIISALLLVAFGIAALHLAIPFFLRNAIAKTVLRQKIRNDKVYLTFDDGPDPVNTPKTLDTLRGHGAKATFFFIGEAVEKHPEIVKRIEAEGHALGIHGYQHLHPRESSPRASFHDIKKGILALREIGVASSLWRPPYGKASLPTLIYTLYEGLDLVHLTVDPRDYDPSKTPSTLSKWLSTNTIPRKRHSVARRKTLATGREEHHA
jgi:peptidoglycan/xylan/chitin deacetylase (PgdA/CDA1 family)